MTNLYNTKLNIEICNDYTMNLRYCQSGLNAKLTNCTRIVYNTLKLYGSRRIRGTNECYHLLDKKKETKLIHYCLIPCITNELLLPAQCHRRIIYVPRCPNVKKKPSHSIL